MAKSSNWVPPPKDKVYMAFADIAGSYKTVVRKCKDLPRQYWIREDGFVAMNGKPVHRVYCETKEMYSKLARRDIFCKPKKI